MDWIINFWTDRKALSANCLSLQLEMMDISNLLNYLHHVQSQTNEKYEPVTGDGLTERQLFEVLEKSIADAETGKCFTHEEVMESLRKQIEEYKENNPIAKLTLDFSRLLRFVRGEALVRKQMGEAQPKNALGQNREGVSQKYRPQKRQTGDILANRIRRVFYSICREHHG